MLLGLHLSSEEYGPDELVEQARLAEEAGFDLLEISDHFHPWNDAQGQSPFVWSVIGAISRSTSLPVMTAVTCPLMRLSPVITAQAAATSAVLLGGRFRLGVGTGEALNEHIHADAWPRAAVRREMLSEAVHVMRRLWSGENVSFEGKHYTVDNARLYTVPDVAPEIWISGFGPDAVQLAAEQGDGFVTVSSDLLETYRSSGGTGRAAVGLKAAWAPSEEEGLRHAHRLWSNAGLPGELAQILPTPTHFEQASELVTPEMTASAIVCGPDVARHVAAFEPVRDFDEVYVAPVGPYWREMIEHFGSEVLPEVRAARTQGATR